MTGHHRRKQWTPRTVRRMLYGFDGPRPFLHIVIPGKLGEATEHKDDLFIDRYGPIAMDLLSKIRYTERPIWGVDYGYPPYLKYSDVGVWRGRFVITLTLYHLNREGRDPFPGIANFINQIQKSAGCLATVYGMVNPISRWSYERYSKMMPDYKYFDLYRKYPEPRKYTQ